MKKIFLSRNYLKIIQSNNFTLNEIKVFLFLLKVNSNKKETFSISSLYISTALSLSTKSVNKSLKKLHETNIIRRLKDSGSSLIQFIDKFGKKNRDGFLVWTNYVVDKMLSLKDELKLYIYLYARLRHLDVFNYALKYYSKVFKKSERTISKWIGSLEKLGLINVERKFRLKNKISLKLFFTEGKCLISQAASKIEKLYKNYKKRKVKRGKYLYLQKLSNLKCNFYMVFKKTKKEKNNKVELQVKQKTFLEPKKTSLSDGHVSEFFSDLIKKL